MTTKTLQQWIQMLTTASDNDDEAPSHNVSPQMANDIVDALMHHPKMRDHDADLHEPQADLYYFMVNGREINVTIGKGRGNKTASVCAYIEESVSMNESHNYEFNAKQSSKKTAFYDFLRHSGVFQKTEEEADEATMDRQPDIWVLIEKNLNWAFYRLPNGKILCFDWYGEKNNYVSKTAMAVDQMAEKLSFLGKGKKHMNEEVETSDLTESMDDVSSLLKGNPVSYSNKKAGAKFHTALKKSGFKQVSVDHESDSGHIKTWQHGRKKYEVSVDHSSDETGHYSMYARRLKESEDLTESSDPMRDWIIHQLEKTERPHNEIVKDFEKKFGKDKIKQLDKIIDEIVGA